MGQFFTNVQLHAGDASPAALRPKIAARLRSAMSAQGWAEVADAALAERTCHLAIGAGDWLAVYDSATESQDDALLRRLAGDLSVEGRTALAILVHDGDLLQMWLHRDGALVDALDSWPGYFDGRMPVVVPHTFDAWRDVLADGVDGQALQAAWATERFIGALPLLARMSAALGMDPVLAALGADSVETAEDIDLLSLHFAAR
jgi:hypothetical protein